MMVLTIEQRERLDEIGALCPLPLQESDKVLEEKGLIEVYRGPDFKGDEVEQIEALTAAFYENRYSFTIVRNEEVLSQFDEKDGVLKGYSSIGGYSVIFLDTRNNVLCAACASKQLEEIEKAFVHWEGAPLACDECSEELESEYGEPEDTLAE